MTKQNKETAKYRIWGLVIMISALFIFAFGILLYQEQLQLSAISQSGLISPR